MRRLFQVDRAAAQQETAAQRHAFDHGITHFDVAQSYGFGDAEKVLGQFMRGQRDKLTVTSKFGIVAPQLKTWQRIARPIVRPLRSVLAPLRRQVRAASGLWLRQSRRLVVMRSYWGVTGKPFFAAAMAGAITCASVSLPCSRCSFT